MLRVRYAEHIDYKRAQECRLRLLESDIGAQRNSFQLLPAYKALLQQKALGVHIDLVRDRHSGPTKWDYLYRGFGSENLFMLSCSRGWHPL